jgi:undecaprenyl-diphosphatase
MAYLINIILGIVQGLTEFLPVSSSGHLALLEHLFRLDQSQRLSYSAFLHLGTTFALLYYFRKKIASIITDLFNKSEKTRQKQSFRLVLMILIGTIPAAIIGIFALDKLEQFFCQPYYTGIFLIITGIILHLTRFAKIQNRALAFKYAVMIGIAQAIALLPGISRSGITISTALFLGLSGEDSFEFSFLLSIPAVLGANILTFKQISINLSPILIIFAILIPFVVGVIGLALLRKFVVNKKLYYFAFYCWLIAILVLVFLT